MNATLVKLMCMLSLTVCSEAREWAFVQSAGGIALGAVSENKGEWSLAVRANVSGLEEITVKPTVINSALVCTSTSASITGSDIYLTIHAGIIREGYTTSCPEAHLGRIHEGAYRVFYRSPHDKPAFLGEIQVGAASLPGTPLTPATKS